MERQTPKTNENTWYERHEDELDDFFRSTPEDEQSLEDFYDYCDQFEDEDFASSAFLRKLWRELS